MRPFTTTLSLLALLIVLCVGSEVAVAQPGPELGDDFIFFVDGTNVQVPTFDGEIVNDPLDPNSGNKVMKYNDADFSFQAFRFEPGTGVDLTTNQEEGDMLFLRLLSDPANVGQANVTITLTDKTDNSGADDGSADLEFRLQWRIPEEMHNGEWHDLAIPLPPLTWQELEDARTAGTLDALAEPWSYGGAWSLGGFPVALDGQGPNSGDRPDLFEEFEWTNVWAIGVFFDNNTPGGSVWLDDVYIGDDDVDLAVATEAPVAMSGASFAPDGTTNLISWNPLDDVGGYNVYASDQPIDDISAPGVFSVGFKAFDAEAFEVTHSFEVPHPSLAPFDIYYAVTSLSDFGVENPDVSNSGGMVANPDLPVQPFIIELTEDEGNTLFDNLSAGVVSREGFPEGLEPFRLDQNHISPSEGTLPDDDNDLSASVWLGYTPMNELFIYAEVTDDVIGLAGAETPGMDAWNNDSVELGWGNYDVRDVEGGSILLGSPHQGMERGDFADYQFRLSGHGDGSITHTYENFSLGGDVQGGGTAFEVMTDEGGIVETGWKILSLIPLDAIQNAAEGDAVLEPPTGMDIRFLPLNIAINDDDGNARETQVQWSLRSNTSSQWWNTPAQWPTVAMAGRGATATANEDEPGVPETFALQQNYPNPFNPTTAISFTLPQSQSVTLSVFDMLGRKVATLVEGNRLEPGAHTVRFDARGLASGVYLYRLEAGDLVQSKRMLLLK